MSPRMVFFDRFFYPQAMSFHLFMVLSCALFFHAACVPFFTKRMQGPRNYDSRSSRTDAYDAGFQEIYSIDNTSGYYPGISMKSVNIENVCTNSHSFCFPSTLPGFLAEEKKSEANVSEVSENHHDVQLSVELSHISEKSIHLNWSSDVGLFKLSNGQSVSCSLKSEVGSHYKPLLWTYKANNNDLYPCRGPIVNSKRPTPCVDENSEIITSSLLDGLSPHVEITPAFLDWGQSFLYFPSVAYLTVGNTCNHSILHVYELYSTSMHFYSCNDSGFSVGPGEVASICFVFLPSRLGLSSAHLILQTSSGGFLVQAKGFVIESPYGLLSSIIMDVSSRGIWHQELSLSNPFDETLYVEEVTIYMVVSSGNTSRITEGSCTTQGFNCRDDLSFLSTEDWLKNGQLAMRPHRTWEIGPHNSETVIEFDFSVESEGKKFGVICMQLLRSLQNKIDTVFVPVEVKLGGKVAYDDHSDSFSVLIEPLLPCNTSGTIAFALLLKHRAPYLLSIDKITEVSKSAKLFLIKYVEGLIVFPSTITNVAVITYSHLPIYMPAHDMKDDCKLHISTNDSSSPQIDIPCQDVFHTCSKQQENSHVSYMHQAGYSRTESFGGSSSQSLLETKGLKIAEVDEMVLRNWKAQGTSGFSVLEDHELLFPAVQVGSHHWQWITVKNPTQQPVVMQLLLNSGEIIDECECPDWTLQPTSLTSMFYNESTTPTRYGFSISNSALTEVYVHPYGRARVGPVLFQPSSRCWWRSSVLIRNNLSGVEWIFLRGFGGSLSLVLFEGSDPVQSLEFNINMRPSISLPNLFHEVDTASGCSVPLTKEVYAKNMGDLPLEIKKIEVSGAECGLGGFIVHTCKGFSLEPGESRMLQISYQADFLAAIVQRDLELALATGIFVIPMKATLPLHMLNQCAVSVAWMPVKKSSMVLIIATFFTFLIIYWLLPQVMIALGSENDLFKIENSSVSITRDAGNFAHVHQKQRKDILSVSSSTMDNLLRPVGECKSSMVESNCGHSKSVGGNLDPGPTSQYLKPSSESSVQMNAWLNIHNEGDLSSHVLLNSGEIECCDALPSQPKSLIVRTAQEKKRRQRKRKGTSVRLTGVEVCSSQSENSTPSSPLSPVSSISTPKQTGPLTPDADHSAESKNSFSRLGNQNCKKVPVVEPAFSRSMSEPKIASRHTSNCSFSSQGQHSESKIPGRPVVIHNATFSRASSSVPRVSSSSFFASSSSIASCDPGSESYNQKTALTEEKGGHDSKFIYNIWGDHISGQCLTGRSRELSTISSCPSEGNSGSFFAKGPHALGGKAQPRSVSYNQNG